MFVTSWSRSDIRVLIEDRHQKYPYLCAIKNPKYKNKYARVQQYRRWMPFWRFYKKPKVTINDIKSKFHALKITFLNEHRKQEKSCHSGAGEGNVSLSSIQVIMWLILIIVCILSCIFGRCGIMAKCTTFLSTAWLSCQSTTA